MTLPTLTDQLERTGGLVSITFGKSISVHYPMAVHLAKRAASYSRLDDQSDEKKAVHLAIFARTREQAGHAAALTRIVAPWKTAQIHTTSKLDANPSQISEVLECYFKSLAVADHRAHCYWIHKEGAFGEEPERELIPCQQLNGYMNDWFDESETWRAIGVVGHSRIHALAVARNCDWCPNFSLRDCEGPPQRALGAPVIKSEA